MAKSMTTRILEEFREGLREVMDVAKISQTALAQKALIKRHWVNQVLLGKRSVRVNREHLEGLREPLLTLVSGHEQSMELRDRIESLFNQQLEHQGKSVAGWNTAIAAQVATELLAGLVDDGLSKNQMSEVSTFLQALVGAMKEEN